MLCYDVNITKHCYITKTKKQKNEIFCFLIERHGVDMYISKKDLLAITGISYGQLYRWKRERLIPEEWFMKQSSFTGQETFFPREQILSRIRSILELKDKYSLEELAMMLSPKVVKATYTKSELELIKEINQDLWELFDSMIQRDTYEYVDVLIMILASEVKHQFRIHDITLSQLLKTILSGNLLGKVFDMNINLIQIGEEFYTILVKEEQSTVIDDRMKVVYKKNLGELSNQIKLEYQNIFR